MIDLSKHSWEVAPKLLGATLVCRNTAAVIVEVEAYHQDDPAAHSYGGVPTKRTKVMFGASGHLYVYFTYGMHWCANVVTGEEGTGEAVLLRAGIPVYGKDLMIQRRKREHDLCNGPAKLVESLGIKPNDLGVNLIREGIDTLSEALKVSNDMPLIIFDQEVTKKYGIKIPIKSEDISVGTRIGISKAQELKWRFGVRGSKYLSKSF